LRDLKVDFDERLNLFFEGFDKFFWAFVFVT
jgi:hypothetical protein